VRELLEGSGTESAGLRALSAEELDWSRAEVLLLDGDLSEGEEVEALLVIPAVGDGTGGQALWGRTRAAIDPGQATYARVTVKKTAQGSYQVTTQNVQTTPGRELDPAFRYCPYQYYGQMSSFRRALCQNYWEVWYGKDYERLRTLVPREEYLETQALTYNQLAAAGARPLLLLQDNEVRVGLYGFPGDLSGEDLEELLQYIRDLESGKTQPPSEDTLLAYEWDVTYIREKLEELLRQYQDDLANGTDPDTALQALKGRILDLRLDPQFQPFYTQIVEWLNGTNPDLNPLLDLLAGLISGAYNIPIDVAWNLIQLVIGAGQGVDTSQWAAENQAILIIATFVVLMGEYPILQEILMLLDNQGHELQGRTIVGIVFSLAAFKAQLEGQPTLDRLTQEFLQSVKQALQDLERYRWTDEYLEALTAPYLHELGIEQLSNLAASFITYVKLTDAGWEIWNVPAAECFSGGGCAPNIPNSNIHIIAYSEDLNYALAIHVQSELTLEDLDKGLIDDLERAMKDFAGYMEHINVTYGTNISSGFAILAESVETGAIEKLKEKLSQLNLQMPVYVVYVDEQNVVRGFCVGPCPSNADDILDQLAQDRFGVGIDQPLLEDSAGSDSQSLVAEPVPEPARCGRYGNCLTPMGL
jgi:hypothetical protein